MSTPRVVGYDDLHDYLESSACIEQELADDYSEMDDDKAEIRSYEHWAKAEAYREVAQHIERELVWSRG